MLILLKDSVETLQFNHLCKEHLLQQTFPAKTSPQNLALKRVYGTSVRAFQTRISMYEIHIQMHIMHVAL